jgi:type III secretory pathway component EscV
MKMGEKIGEGCVWIIVIVIVIGLFEKFPIFMSCLLGVGSLCFFIGFLMDHSKKEKEIKKAEAEKLLEDLRKGSEARREQRQQYASELKTKRDNVIRQCESNLTNSKKVLIPTYESIDKQKEAWNTLDKILLNVAKLENTVAELNAKEDNKAKCEISVENKLIEYKNKLNELKITVQENIARLEAKEKEICEQAIDCEVVAGEHKFALENLLSEARKISNSHKDEISEEEKEVGERKLDIIKEESDIEYKELQAASSSNPKFTEYFSLVREQQSIVKDIELNMSALNEHNSEVEQLGAIYIKGR